MVVGKDASGSFICARCKHEEFVALLDRGDQFLLAVLGLLPGGDVDEHTVCHKEITCGVPADLAGERDDLLGAAAAQHHEFHAEH